MNNNEINEEINVDVKTGLGTIVGASAHVFFAGIVLGQGLFWHVPVEKKRSHLRNHGITFHIRSWETQSIREAAFGLGGQTLALEINHCVPLSKWLNLPDLRFLIQKIWLNPFSKASYEE